MEFQTDQVEELKSVTPNLSVAEEGGYTYILIEGYQLPTGCNPAIVDLLLCPMARDGYQSRLYFPQKITGCTMTPNWNGTVRVLGRTWEAFSWRTESGLRLLEMLLVHLKGLRR
jgi:hypothetical protein